MTPGAIAGLLSGETAKGQDPLGLTGLMATNGHVSDILAHFGRRFSRFLYVPPSEERTGRSLGREP